LAESTKARGTEVRASGEQARSPSPDHDEFELVRTLERIGGTIATELDVHRIVQVVTDEATKLVGAQFGAFFYNALDERGESYTLYTLSGVPREAFSTFPMPRNTAVFQPTFHGTGVVRSDDITKDPRYGHNAPHHGMPKGHLPVRSYLAVPVLSRGREVLGGLFFGHEDTGVFGERDERLIVGIAGWASVAMENARLYEAQVRAREQLERALLEAHEARLEAERANLAKSQFLAAMSHELRTPLNAIQEHVQLLEMGLRGPVTEEQKETLMRVQRSQRVLQSLINDVLDFARLEAGRVEFEIQPVDVAEVVASVVQMIEPRLAAKSLAFTVDIPASLRVTADVDKLRQILINLLSNAIKFTDAGGRIAIDAPRRAGQPDEEVFLRVSDTGRGVPREKQDEIFDPFVQLQGGATGEPHGIGLGLAISRDLARGMKGDLRVRSFEGLGSAFTITLPRG
jgi:signal transduction histidine kinase